MSRVICWFYMIEFWISNAFIVIIESNLDMTIDDDLVLPDLAEIGVRAYDWTLLQKVVFYLMSRLCL